MYINFRVGDSTNALNQFVPGAQFTCDAMTTDRNGILGRVIDTMGPGPSLSNDTLYTVYANKQVGAVHPLPPSYPEDPLNDWITQPDLSSTFPYVNYDLQSFTVSVH